MSATGSPREAFSRLLQQDESDAGWAKLQAFASLCELDPHPDGPGPAAIRRVLRGRLDDRIPPDWRPAFVAACHQWEGYLDGLESRGQRPRTPRPGTWRPRLVLAAVALTAAALLLGPRLLRQAPATDGADGAPAGHRPPAAAVPDLRPRLAEQVKLSASGSDEDIAALLAGDERLVEDFRAARRALLGVR